MPIPRKLLRGTNRSYDIERLIVMKPAHSATPSERVLFGLRLPPWQRPACWTDEQQARLIESILMGLGCGYYVTNGMDWDSDGAPLPMAGWLLDGQQRITAIRDFIAGDVAIFDGMSWKDLSEREKRSFLREPFPCHELDYTSDEAVLLDLYDRLNFGGTPHSIEDRHPVR